MFTEALQFYDHSESMVRIAVRTLTLNIFRVRDDAMNKFVLQCSDNYFNRVCFGVAEQIVEMDVFARSAQSEPTNRDRLVGMIDAHLDHMHYLNDILMINHTELVSGRSFMLPHSNFQNSLLITSMFAYIIGPLYLSSLGDLRSHSTILLSKVSALFLLSQRTA